MSGYAAKLNLQDARICPFPVVPVGNSNPPILMVQSAQDGRDEDMAARLDGAWEWRVFA